MDSPLILTFDFGTQSVRAAIFDREGNMLACEKKPYEPAYVSPKPGYAEQDPSYYFDCLCLASNALAKNHSDLLKKIKGITMTCFRDSAVLLDEKCNVIRPMILWLDQRYAKCEEKLPFFSRFLFALVGKSATIDANRRRTMANWIKENEPENWKRCDKYVSLSTYFIYRLTGQLKDSPSDFTGHYPLDYQKKAWYKKPETHLQGQVFSLKKNQLPELVPEGTLLGEISEEASRLTGIPAGIKMYAAGSDKSCETLGCGVINESMASISLGTACSIETTSKKFVHPFPFLPSYPSVLADRYNLDFQIYRGYWMINWFLKEFGAMNIEDLVVSDPNPEEYNKKLFSIPPGSDGVMVQPYWGSQLDKPEVKGTITGFSDTTTKEHVYKAIIEGISYEMREVSESFEKKLKTTFKEIRIAGGGSRSDEICQITADIFGKPVVRVQTNETASLGAAMSGFLSIGEFHTPEEAVKAMVRVTDRFEPNEENHRIYQDYFENGYKKMYPKLKGILRFLHKKTAR